jgi:anti-sigma regulatory factor (Ser/Thr protein kinase)
MPDTLRHEAMPYTGHDVFVSTCVALAQDAMTHEQPMLLLAESPKVDDVRTALGPDADYVTFVVTDEHGRNPNRIVTMLEGFQAGGRGRRSLGVNESFSTARSRVALAEAQFAESVLNAAALQSWALDVLCLYDTSTVDAAVLSEMRRSHPFVRGEDANPDFRPGLADTLFGSALLAGPDDVVGMDVLPDDLAEARLFVRAYAVGQQVAPDRLDDFVMAVNEIMTNSIRHGGGRARLTLWTDDPHLVCQVADSGHITDPLAGRLAPPAAATSGRGLWLANHLCDLVQIRSSAAAGTVVRLFVERL